ESGRRRRAPRLRQRNGFVVRGAFRIMNPQSSSAPDASANIPMRLGELLIERGLIAAEDLDRALELQKERGDKLGRILVDMGYLAQRDLLSALSAQLGLPIATLSTLPSAPELEGLSPRFLRQSLLFPVSIEENTLTLAMADPLDFEA